MNRTTLTLLGLAGAGAALYLVGVFDQDEGEVLEVGQGLSTLDQTLINLNPWNWDLSTYLDESDPMNNANVSAFLKVIRFAEGTSGEDGYAKIFWTRGGPNLLTTYADHPRVAKQFKVGDKTYWTSAAGAYQFMAISPLPNGKTTRVNTWDRLKAKLSLADFSPANQDRAAVELVSEAGALADVRAGRFEVAIEKCRGIWASLPGATYGQPTKKIGDLRNVYAQAGGTINQA